MQNAPVISTKSVAKFHRVKSRVTRNSTRKLTRLNVKLTNELEAQTQLFRFVVRQITTSATTRRTEPSNRRAVALVLITSPTPSRSDFWHVDLWEKLSLGEWEERKKKKVRKVGEVDGS